ncbi:MAG: hypothetical protein RL676_570, partial [Pseudomonadota bacterium]
VAQVAANTIAARLVLIDAIIVLPQMNMN